MEGEAARQGFTVETGLYVEWAYPGPGGAPKAPPANAPELAAAPKRKAGVKTSPRKRKPG
jgi:hypothetical protein